MAGARKEELELILLNLLPADGSAVGNGRLSVLWLQAAEAAGHSVHEADFTSVREELVARGLAIRGKGRGGSTGRAAPATPTSEAFTLSGAGTREDKPSATRKAKLGASKPRLANEGGAQVLSYRHADRRKNNPEVGLVNEASDPEQPKKEWAYSPHLDPVLNFDSGRSELESLVNDALASGDEAAMSAALSEIQRRGAPYLQWTGKAERTTFEVDTVSLHVHERIDPMSILSAVRKQLNGENDGPGDKVGTKAGRQASLFEAPFEAMPLRNAVDFYRHDKGWANRLVSGDSLHVMNSLLIKEGMAGQVQMIYIDPPYGIKYGSNFQPFVQKEKGSATEVKDRSDADLTQEPEMIKAFRDTWELGIHSYLSYLRDRLLLGRDLLSNSGSVFVQIGDENVHLIRNLLDEILGADNFVSLISLKKTGGQSSNILAGVCDYIVWYAKDKSQVKYHALYAEKEPGEEGAKQYNWAEFPDGTRRPLIKEEMEDGHSGRTFQPYPLVSMGEAKDEERYDWRGDSFFPSKGRHWSVAHPGLPRLDLSGRLMALGKTLRFVNFIDDYPVTPLTNLWTDTQTSGFAGDRYYVVQTLPLAIERCMLMSTDPGDLVLDPTCGSGTTAFVAEQWGRRWITCDTSRVAVTLAKQRLMTASFDYYELAYPHEGIKGAFIYKTVPHVTLKSIANNSDIDAIYERLHPAIDRALEQLNIVLSKHPLGLEYLSPEGFRKGQKLEFRQPAFDTLKEWEVPYAFPSRWPEVARDAFSAFHSARQKMQKEMDRAIAAQAENETLYDQPEKSKTKVRITGPFTVEAVPFPTVLSLEAAEGGAAATPTEDQAYQASIARSGETSRQQQWRDELLKTGIRGKGGQILKFAELEVMTGTTCLHATGTLAETGERVVVSFGPEHGALEQRQVEHALGEASELFPRPKMIVFCAFTFDPEAAKDIDAVKGITALKAQMNTDLLTEDLKKNRASNQSFWLMGQPDVALTQTRNGRWQVEVNGFDYFDTVKGELISGGKTKIAMWSLDTDYDGRSLFPHQVFFPMASKDEGWKKLKKTIRAELDESLLDQFHGTVSLPFESGKHGKAAVKIVDDRGIESLKILPLDPPLKGAA